MNNARNTSPSRRISSIGEERKVRTNLSKLIHTVQHLPSDRYHVHASSLWGVINELESFQTPHMDNPESPRKSSKKIFSRKYLDLRLYPSPDRLSCPKCDSAPKLKKLSTTRNNIINNDNKKKRADFKKGKQAETIRNICREHKPPRKLQSKHTKENIFPVSNSKKREPSQAKTKLLPKDTTQKPLPRPNSEEKLLSNKFSNPEKPQYTDIHQSKKNNLFINDKFFKYKVKDKYKGFRSSSLHQNKVRDTNMLVASSSKGFLKETQMGKDQASMVKKLTSYWNNLLNNEIDEITPVEKNTNNVNKSLQDIVRSVHQYGKNRRRTNRMISRTRSDSSLTVLKNVGHRDENTFRTKIAGNVLHFNYSSKMALKKDKYEIFSRLQQGLLCDIGDAPENQNFSEACKINFFGKAQNQADEEREMVQVDECKFHLTIQDAIRVMEKLICKLKPFSGLSLTSEQINLSHSLRTMICLMTATVFSSDKDIFGEDIECHMGLEDVTDEERVGKNEHIATKHECNSGSSKNREENNVLTLVPIQGITLRQVEDALRYLSLWKEFLWTEFISNPGINGDSFFSCNKSYNSPQTFTFVIEEEIVLENNCPDNYEDDYCHYDTEDEDDENNSKEFCTDNMLDRLLDWIFDIFLIYWPESVQECVAAVYKVAASLLVFWIVIKELLGK